MINSGRHRFFSLFGAAVATSLLVVACGGGGDDKDEAKKDKDDQSSDDTDPTTAAPAPGTSYFATAQVPEVAVYDAADGGQEIHALANPIKSGAPLVFLVDGDDNSGGTRLPVYLPVQPNGSKGWIDASQVSVTANPYKITVELAEFKLTVTKNEEPIIETDVGLGIPENDWDTPSGMYFLKELLKNPNPDNVYGPYAYGISAFTENPEVADEFGDGGVIGIHGNNDPSTIGTYASHGCIRLPNDKITEMAELLPLGTPVEIV